MNNKNNTEQTEQTNDQAKTEEKISFGVPTLSNGMYRLWEAAADNLSVEHLKFFSGFTEEAERASRNLSEVVMDVGCLIGADEHAGNLQNKEDVSTLLFSISHQLDCINAMLQVGGLAEYRLNNPSLFKKAHKN